MSKTETATGSSASAPSQLIQQIKQLQQQMEQSRAEIDQLPPAIAQQVTEALAPLEGLSLTEIERLAQVQRTTLDAMATEMTSQATKSFETSTRRLLTTISQTSQQLESSTSSLETAAKAATTLEEQSQSARQSWVETAILVMSGALFSAVMTVALIGVLDSNKLALLKAEDPRLNHVLERATDVEFKLIQEIYSRPAP